MDTKTKSHPMNKASNNEFRLCILTPYALHYLAESSFRGSFPDHLLSHIRTVEYRYNGYTLCIQSIHMDKSAGFHVRIDPRLRRDFVSACRTQDRTAAQVLRDFMRDYISQHYADQQEILFAEETTPIEYKVIGIHKKETR
jgi:hypothetical protein